MNGFGRLAALAGVVVALLVSGFASARTESTVVLRVVGTSPAWGQESRPAWPNAAPVKDAAGYSLYDVEIARDASMLPSRVTLYKFGGWSSGVFGMPDAQYRQYWRTSSLLSREWVATTAAHSSEQALGALQAAFAAALAREHPTRIVIDYSGHGSPSIFFEGMLTMRDGQALLASLREAAPGIPLVLDFSTNCDVGFFDFVLPFHDRADFLIASEKQVGGFDIDNALINDFLANLHDNNYHRFWSASSSIDEALDAMIAARRNLWNTAGRASIVAGHVEQSIVAYRLAAFEEFMLDVSRFGGLDSNALRTHANDIGSFVYATNDPALIASFERFRIRYASDRSLFAWSAQTYGFSVLNGPTLRTYLAQLTPSVAAEAIEYYNARLDHYFLTWRDDEIAALDAGTSIAGWTRTDRSFKVLTAAAPGAVAVCRFYIPPAYGDSHFLGRGSDECAGTAAAHPAFVLEAPAFMYMYLPDDGLCPPGTEPVYRVFDDRPDANHRYTADPSLRDAMVAGGWLAEGDGDARVVMCAPG